MTSFNAALGGQWGDEGKAKIIDFLSKDYEVIVRYQGGANAGHTVVLKGKKFIMHHLPSGIFNPGTTCVLGQGMVINLVTLADELKRISADESISKKILISQNAFLVLDYHIEIDKQMEESKGAKIGTTFRGIGPAYRDKVSRVGIRLEDFKFSGLLKEKINLAIKNNENWLNVSQYTEEKINHIIKKNDLVFQKFKNNVIDTAHFLNHLKDEKVLFEGAQGAGLDIDLGTYPYVTCSSSTSGGIAIGTGVPPNKLTNVIGIFKAYVTRVGAGALPTKLSKKELETLRQHGGEFGATTGRPRDCGWFDGLQAKYSIMVNGINQLALTKLDVFDHYETMKFATHYEYEGKEIKVFPTHDELLRKVKPVYKTFPLWEGSIFGLTDFNELPSNAKAIISFMESFLNCPIKYISTGPEREHTIVRHLR